MEWKWLGVRATVEQLSRDLAGDPKHIYKHKYDRKAHLAGDPKKKDKALLRWDACLYTKNQSRNNKMMKNNETMKKMGNGEKVIGMLHHVTIRLRYRSCK